MFSGILCMVLQMLIGASLSEPHTSESNGGFFIYYYYIYIYLSAVRKSFRKCRLSSFNPKHCARRSVRAKNRKQSSTPEPFTSATPTDRVKLPNQRGSKKIGDGAERDRTRRAAETADQRSERLRN